MNGKTTTLVAAIAIGFLTGVALAAGLGGWLAWILGPISGGLVGYFSYNFKAVLRAIPRAWAEISKWRITEKQALVVLRATGRGLGAVLLSFITFLVVGTSVMAPLVAAVSYVSGQPLEADPVNLFLLFILTIVMVGGIFTVCSGAIADAKGVKAAARYGEYLWYALVRFNPVAAWIYWPIRGIIWAIPRIPKAVVVLGRFFSRLFRLIHSERRLIAGVWAFLGVLSWLLSVPFWICFAGSVLGGVISVELIGKRLLKTLPAYNGA